MILSRYKGMDRLAQEKREGVLNRPGGGLEQHRAHLTARPWRRDTPEEVATRPKIRVYPPTKAGL